MVYHLVVLRRWLDTHHLPSILLWYCKKIPQFTGFCDNSGGALSLALSYNNSVISTIVKIIIIYQFKSFILYPGNMWGQCANGTEAVGCGKAETFRNCADVSIVSNAGGGRPPTSLLYNRLAQFLNQQALTSNYIVGVTGVLGPTSNYSHALLQSLLYEDKDAEWTREVVKPTGLDDHPYLLYYQDVR